MDFVECKTRISARIKNTLAALPSAGDVTQAEVRGRDAHDNAAHMRSNGVILGWNVLTTEAQAPQPPGAAQQHFQLVFRCNRIGYFNPAPEAFLAWEDHLLAAGQAVGGIEFRGDADDQVPEGVLEALVVTTCNARDINGYIPAQRGIDRPLRASFLEVAIKGVHYTPEGE